MDEQEYKTTDAATAAVLSDEDRERLERIKEMLAEIDEKLLTFESVRRKREAQTIREEARDG